MKIVTRHRLSVMVVARAFGGGKLRPDSRTAAFIDSVKGRPVHLALSGRTMEVDGAPKCVRGG